MANKIPKLNQHNEIIGETTIAEAKESGWPRRIVRIFIFDEARRMLLQRRGKNVHNFPDMWDQAIGGHVDVGESYKEAAVRELMEELGIEVKDLTTIVEDFKNTACFDALFTLMLPSDTQFTCNPHEVGEVRWFTIAEFENLAAAQPEQFVPPFMSAWRSYRDRLLESQ